jgi:hypothetical protein
MHSQFWCELGRSETRINPTSWTITREGFKLWYNPEAYLSKSFASVILKFHFPETAFYSFMIKAMPWCTVPSLIFIQRLYYERSRRKEIPIQS